MNTNIKTITRKQIKAYGATDYLARSITKLLTPISKQGSFLLYRLSDVLASIDTYVQRRIRKPIRELLPAMRNELVKLNLGISANDRLEQPTASILEEQAKFEQAVAKSKQRQQKFYPNYRAWIKGNLAKYNNIVAFDTRLWLT